MILILVLIHLYFLYFFPININTKSKIAFLIVTNYVFFPMLMSDPYNPKKSSIFFTSLKIILSLNIIFQNFNPIINISSI